MKLVTRPRLLVLLAVLAVGSVGVWQDRANPPVRRDGDVVIDEAFLHRLQTSDERTTRDPAIKGLLRMESRRKTLLDDLRTGKVNVSVKWFHGDSVSVKVDEREEQVCTRIMEFSYHRRTTWEWWSRKWWQEEVLHRPYWNR